MIPVLPGQTAALPVIAPGFAGVPGFTTIVIPVLVAVVGEAQAALDVNITLTTSLLFNVVLVNVGLLVPALAPLTCHW
jgi:hypothetical protein